MGMAEDVAALLATEGVVAASTDVFIGAEAQIPDGDGPYLSLIETAGIGPEYVQNQREVSLEMPGLQLVTRALYYTDARALALAAHAVFPRWNETVNLTWYRSLKALQKPYPIGLDATQRRSRFVFNILGDKKP